MHFSSFRILLNEQKWDCLRNLIKTYSLKQITFNILNIKLSKLNSDVSNKFEIILDFVTWIEDYENSATILEIFGANFLPLLKIQLQPSGFIIDVLEEEILNVADLETFGSHRISIKSYHEQRQILFDIDER